MLRRSVAVGVILLMAGMTAASAKTPATPTAKGSAAKATKKAKPQSQSPATGKTAGAEALRKGIVGTWHQIGGEDVAEFSKSGSFVASNPQVRLEGKYKIRDDGKMEVDIGLGRLRGPMIRKIDLEGDQLTLTDESNGLILKYKRVKPGKKK